MFLLFLLATTISHVVGESLSLRALTGNKPAVSNYTRLSSIFTSRQLRWEETLNFACEQRKDDDAVHAMAKARFGLGCLGDSSLGVVPQLMGKLASCYCSFNITICNQEIEVNNCVIAGPGRRSSRGFSIESAHIYHVGFSVQLGGQMLDGRLDLVTEAADLPRNQTLADGPAAIMASARCFSHPGLEFSGWAYRVEMECFALRSSGFCRRLAVKSTWDHHRKDHLDLLAIIFGICGALAVGCFILFIHWVFKENRRRKRETQYQYLKPASPRRLVDSSVRSFDCQPSIRIHEYGPQSTYTSSGWGKNGAHSTNTSSRRTFDPEADGRRFTYL